MRRLIRRLAGLPAVCGILLIRTYRLLLSPWLGYHCRFQPTCSAYGIEAISRHGLVKGGWLTLRRLARCHPWGGSGFEPVPPVEPTRSHAQCRDHAHQHR